MTEIASRPEPRSWSPPASMQIIAPGGAGGALVVNCAAAISAGWSMTHSAPMFMSFNVMLNFLFVFGGHDVGASTMPIAEGTSENDASLLNCLEHVSYVRVLSGLVVLC
jgi:hypothetical protein